MREREFAHDDIIAHRFTSGRRKGYDTVEVDRYLKRLAEYVGWMQGELARHQATERTALDVLQQAQRVADGTVASAQSEAQRLLGNAAEGLENARKDARATLDAARAEADNTLLSARVQAESAVEDSRSRTAQLEAAGMERLDEINRLVEELSNSAAKCASDLRSTGERLLEMADHFQFEFEIPSLAEESGVRDDGSVDLDEGRLEVT